MKDGKCHDVVWLWLCEFDGIFFGSMLGMQVDFGTSSCLFLSRGISRETGNQNVTNHNRWSIPPVVYCCLV